jgi:hypothetical protein
MHTKTLSIYDPAMCCSTGVCGPEVDPKLARFSADLEWLRSCGVNVERFNLAQEPGAFASTPLVKAALEEAGEAALPIFLVDGRLVMSGTYPTRDQLAAWTGASTAAAAATTSGCCSPSSNSKKSSCC